MASSGWLDRSQKPGHSDGKAKVDMSGDGQWQADRLDPVVPPGIRGAPTPTTNPQPHIVLPQLTLGQRRWASWLRVSLSVSAKRQSQKGVHTFPEGCLGCPACHMDTDRLLSLFQITSLIQYPACAHPLDDTYLTSQPTCLKVYAT